MRRISNTSKINLIVLTCFSFICLFFGGMIYLVYRPHYLLMFSWLEFFGIENCFLMHTFNTNNNFFSYFVFCLPNGLWLLSFLILLGIIWKQKVKLFTIYSLIFLTINCLVEFLQLTTYIPGTFDILDIITLVISFLIGMIAYKFIILRS